MKPNLGAFDGAFRTLLFVLSVCWAVMGGSWLWVIPGAILFATAILSWCPVYAMIGIDTHKHSAPAH